MTLSVVIPARNAAPFLEQTLISMDRQVLRPSEVIVVDDGSTDGTSDVAASFRFGDGSCPVVVRHEASRGVAVARNHGVDLAQGTWVGLCDADDLWHPRRVEAVVAAAEAHPDAVAVGTDVTGFALESDRARFHGHQRAAMVARWIDRDAVEELLTDQPLDVSRVDDVSVADLQQDIVFATTSVCYRRDVYVAAGGCAAWSHLSDDFILNVSVAHLGRVLLIRSPYVLYRLRPDSLSHVDSDLALAHLAAVVAVRYGVKAPDTRVAGSLYKHLLRVYGTREVALGTLVGFGALGGLTPREWVGLARAVVRSRLANLGSR